MSEKTPKGVPSNAKYVYPDDFHLQRVNGLLKPLGVRIRSKHIQGEGSGSWMWAERLSQPYQDKRENDGVAS